jgi:hypothetical protein
MLGLNKNLIPIFFIAAVSIPCSYFVSFAWTFVLFIIPMFWLQIDVHEKRFIENYVKYIPRESLDFIRNSGMHVRITFGSPARSYGIWFPTIVFSPSKRFPCETFNHELGHLYLNHILLNAVYFTWCCTSFSYVNYMYPIATVFLFPVFIVLTNYKTLTMEKSADIIANNFNNIEPYLHSLPDSWFKRKRLAAHNASKST